MIPQQLDSARKLVESLPTTMGYTDAGKLINKLEKLHTGVEASAIEIRFHVGNVIRSIGTERGKGTISKISKEYRISETTLRISRRFADHFDGNVDRMREWVRSQAKNSKLNWQAVVDLTRANRDPRVLGPGRLLKRLTASVERSARDLEAANEVIQTLPEKEREEWKSQFTGVAVALVEESTLMRDETAPVLEGMNEGGLFFRPIKDKKYKAWIHECPCPIKGTIPVDMHHVIGLRGMGEKASDFGAVPLDHELHMEYHNIGHETFEKKYNVNFLELAYNYFHRYITGQWLTLTHLPEPIV